MGMSGEVTARYRKAMLLHAQGDILEIGFGTGLNLPFYPEHVQKIHTVDINAGMNTVARKNRASSRIEVDHYVLNAESLPFANESFDTVVSTWTLCSITNVDRTLQEIHRVLKPAGKFIFVEHGLSDEISVQKWQHRLTPIQKVLADGCHLDRDMEVLIRQAGFRFHSLGKGYAEGVFKPAGYMYYGIAGK